MRVWKTVKIVLFCAIFVLLLNRIYTILSWKDTAGDYYSSVNSFYELEEDIVDVLFFGSSHCYCAVDPSVLWDEHGIASFNLAISGQDFAGTYYTIKEALKTQTPKLLCVDLFGSVFTGYGVEGNLYRNTLSFKLSKNSYETVDSLVVDEERKPEFWLRWPIFHTRYKELKKEDFISDLPTYLGYHAEYNTQDVWDIVVYHGGEATPMPAEREEWLRKIIDLAKEENIELMLFVAPYTAGEEDQKLINYVKELAAKENVPVVDMIAEKDQVGLSAKTDFIDWGHTNHSGAAKVSHYLGDFIAANYDLEDYRGNERYALWDENSKLRMHEEINQDFKASTDFTNYVEKLEGLEDYVVVVSTAGNHLSEVKDISEELGKLGIGSEFFMGGVWVIENGEVVYTNSDANSFKHMDFGYSDLIISRADSVNSVVLNKENYLKTLDGINVLVYDKALGVVADSIGFPTVYDYWGTR